MPILTASIVKETIDEALKQITDDLAKCAAKMAVLVTKP